MLHEFESLLFACPNEVAAVMCRPDGGAKLQEVREQFATPEEINEGAETHPSKRILNFFPDYRKRVHGPLATGRAGLETLRAECPHFDGWVSGLEAVGDE